MRKLFPVLLAAALLPLGSRVASAQRPPRTVREERARCYRMRTPGERRACLASQRREARRARHHAFRERTREHHEATGHHGMMGHHHHGMMGHHGMMEGPDPALLGTPISGYSAGRRARSVTLPTGLRRMPNGLITMDAASAIARVAVPEGMWVKKVKLHMEDGVPVYDVKVMTPGEAGNRKVRIDARSGAVLKIKYVDDPVGTVENTAKRVINQLKP